MGASSSSNLASVPTETSFSTAGAYKKEMPSPSDTSDLMVAKSLTVATRGKLCRV